MVVFGVVLHGYAMLYTKMFHGYDKMKHLLTMKRLRRYADERMAYGVFSAIDDYSVV